jgi:hypothetical protein
MTGFRAIIPPAQLTQQIAEARARHCGARPQASSDGSYFLSSMAPASTFSCEVATLKGSQVAVLPLRSVAVTL